MHGIISKVSISVPLNYRFIFVPETSCFDCNIAFGILDILCFLMEFRVFFYFSVANVLGNLIGIELSL